ncbi:MAG: helix-turn-helix transcriptional regulator [Romboutsia timonensis]|uniref:helix-turn-helix domain-containing protein n=1 Tax=Romboutsia timonensis TaxID=1776391 RepID=UPI002A7550C0|nr:helix-turn-helix transcriptional regulator [Romboutsia timonensis]MDY2883258.1 helix-turn-helix transcriptional regulator [Romboutsia timonensis]
MNYKLNKDLIKSKMLQKGYSITKLASISQISKSTAARAIKGQGNQRPQTIYKISKSLDIDTKDIIL